MAEVARITSPHGPEGVPGGYREEFRVVYMREGWTRPGVRIYKQRATCESFVALLYQPPPDLVYADDYQRDDWLQGLKPLLWTRIDSRLVGPWHEGEPDAV